MKCSLPVASWFTASCQDFAGILPATRGLIAAPWTPASLSLLPGANRRLAHRQSSRFTVVFLFCLPVPITEGECT